jgi:predicted dehydrogenase
MTVRVVVVGTGFGARVVAPAFDSLAGCEVVAVVSAREDVHAAIATRRCDLVSIHSPPFLHADHARAAMEFGRALLCDKPCTASATTTAALLDDAVRSDVLHLVNFEFRHDPVRRALRELVRGGAIGAVRGVEWTHESNGSTVPLRPHGWLFDAALGGGWIGAWASHAVDALRWILDDELEVVETHPRIDIPSRPDRDGVERSCTAEDGLRATLRSRSGIEIRLDSTFAAPEARRPRLAFDGTDGSLVAIGSRLTLTVAGTERDVTPATDPSEDPHMLPMRRFAEIVRDRVVAGASQPDDPTLVDGLAVDRVLEALRARRDG